MATIATVSPTELIRSTWGNSVATELNTRCVKVDGSTPMTGTLVVTVSPGLSLRNSSNQPFFEFASTTGTRYGYIQGGSTLQKYGMESSSGTHTFTVAESTKLTVSSAEVAVTAAFSVTGLSAFNAGMTIGSNGGQLNLVDTSTGGSDFYDTHIGFYGGGVSMVSPGTRTGWVGYAGNNTLQMVNELSGGHVAMTASAGGTAYINSTATVFQSAGVEYGRHTAADFLWGKTASGIGTVGLELTTAGRIMSTVTNNAYTNVYLRRLTDLEGGAYIQFVNAAGGIISHITQDNTAPVGVNFPNVNATAPSDYRLKDELGPVPDALERVMQLAPKRLRWKEGGDPFDGFIAHEVADVVPKAVRGMKDATYTADEAEMMGVEPGDIKPQQLSESALLPLVVAGLQELAQRVEALEAG